MALNERELQEVQQNKSIRGYIVRCLVKGSNNSAITKHISNALFVQGMIMSPDIGKYVDYLVNGGYVEFVDKKIKAYTSYADDAVIKLTNKGINLAEGTVTDPGVEI
ncbi:MAG: hypothetical protein ACLTFZ_11620 [Lachnospiraceae bacterium]